MSSIKETARILPQLFQCIHLVDHRLDNTPDEDVRNLISRQLILFMSDPQTAYPFPDNPDEARLAQNIRSYLFKHPSPTAQSEFSQILSHTEKLRHTLDPQEYAQATAEDGINTARFLLNFLPPEVTRFPLTRTLTEKLGAASKIIDSILDLASDHHNGETQIKPSIRAYAHLTHALIKQFLFSTTSSSHR